MKLNVKRVTLAGTTQAVTFDTVCGQWLVKNFSDNDLYVSFDEDLDEDEAIKIQSGMGQLCEMNEFRGGIEEFKSKSIYLKGTGEVEVQQICFHKEYD